LLEAILLGCPAQGDPSGNWLALAHEDLTRRSPHLSAEAAHVGAHLWPHILGANAREPASQALPVEAERGVMALRRGRGDVADERSEVLIFPQLGALVARCDAQDGAHGPHGEVEPTVGHARDN